MAADAKYRRRRIVVNTGFQLRLVGAFIAAVIVALVLFTGGTVLYYWIAATVGDNVFAEYIVIHRQVERTRELVENGHLVRQTYYESVAQPPIKRWEVVVPAIVANNLVLLVVMTVIGLFYSHRIAGPVYKMNRELRRVLEGTEGVRVKLRKKDQLKDLAATLNAVLDRCEGHDHTSDA
jgi:methyl-accepting chemotaxis protein